MKVKIRKTISGTEYWDNDLKKVLFVPKGNEPPFEVTTDYDSLILKKDSEGNVIDGVVTSVDLASAKDMTVYNDFNIDGMNAEQLLTFAEENNIDVPGTMKKVETIHNYITDALTDAADDE